MRVCVASVCLGRFALSVLVFLCERNMFALRFFCFYVCVLGMRVFVFACVRLGWITLSVLVFVFVVVCLCCCFCVFYVACACVLRVSGWNSFECACVSL